MSLTLEWQRRVDNWRRELPNHFYQAVGSLELEGFTTFEQLTPEQALQRSFQPLPVGTKWGAKWEYAWVRASVTLGEEVSGKRAVVQLNPGGEGVIFKGEGDDPAVIGGPTEVVHPIVINGPTVAGARDWAHGYLDLSQEAVPGQTYHLLGEFYGGHGPTPEGKGPVAYGRASVPEPPEKQQTVGVSTYGIWLEDVYQLWIDVETLYQLRLKLDDNQLRRAEIDAGLKDFSLIVDFEVPQEEMLETVRQARQRLKPLLECTNGSTAPTLYLSGHAHLDVAWLWPLQETERKMARTISNQLALAKEYPDYVYLQSQAYLYWVLQQRYPELYQRLKQAVRAGSVAAEGGMWVEADTNLSGGESLIRQFVYGKRFFEDELGVDCELLWLPDVFGYSAALPQILRGCGVKYFATQKIFWTYNGGDPFPLNTFTWEGMDGSTVLAHVFNDYNSDTHPSALIDRWNGRVQKDDISTFLVAFGWGDGGGGPTRNHLEFALRAKNLEGAPKVNLASPIDFFYDQEKRGVPPARYKGELYFQAHRGTYTSQARTKKNNRRSELLLREAEMWATAAQVKQGSNYPRSELDDAWREVLLLQFHDILPGSSIHRVYEEAEQRHARVIATARDLAISAARSFTRGEEGITLFNSLSWPRKEVVALPGNFQGAVDGAGKTIPVQGEDTHTLAEVEVPACGWLTVVPSEGKKTQNKLNVNLTLLENELLRISFNERGEITSIFDKEIQRELTAGVCNRFMLFKDVPNWFDAWDIDSSYELTPVAIDEPVQVEMLRRGPLEVSLCLTRKLHRSVLNQEIRLRRNSRRIDFITQVDWHENHKLLKVAFPVDIHSEDALHEIQFGHVRRPTHRSRPYDASRFEVCNHKWSALVEENRGVAILNDSKYGINVMGNSINLTLLKSALSPDMTADRGMQEFTYSFYAWNGSLVESEVVRQAYELNVPLLAVAGEGGTGSLFDLDAANVVIEAVKLAEDGGGDVIVRLYEAKRCATRATLHTALPLKSAAACDMLENVQAELPCQEGQVALEFRPFEIKTLRLRLR